MALEDAILKNSKAQHKFAAMNDGDLLMSMADGQHGAYDVFAERYAGALNRLVYRLGFNGAQCEDMLQDILVHLWQKAELWQRQEKISARSWIYRVATNLCIDVQRKNNRQPVQSALDIDVVPLEGTDRSDYESEQRQRSAHIEGALQTLPERARYAIILVYYQEMSNKDAANAMGISVKAIESLLVRGRKKLKKQLQKNQEDI
jgi:RNA polymerase sigma-70 factor (ECF subfamily)